jgi:hypothetical protein
MVCVLLIKDETIEKNPTAVISIEKDGEQGLVIISI